MNNREAKRVAGFTYIEPGERILVCLGDGREIGGSVIESATGYACVVLDNDGITPRAKQALPARKEVWTRKAIYAAFRAGMIRHHDKNIEGGSRDLRAYRLGGATIIVRKN